MRKTDEEIRKICEKNNVDRLWSWSRLNTYANSPYEYFLKYVINAEEDRTDCVYPVMGGLAHSVIEKYYLGEIVQFAMEGAFKDSWLSSIEILELKFDRNDEEKNKKIQDKYYKCLLDFFHSHRKLAEKMQIEQFVTVKIGQEILQGYIDACYKDEEGNFNIIDWKTSSLYKGDKAIKESGQLVIYALGLHQMGVPFEKIKIAWDFLKYVNIECQQANGKKTTREIERSEIGNKLYNSVKMWAKKEGYTGEEPFMERFLETNDLGCLPLSVQNHFGISDCLVYIDLTDELIQYWTDYVKDTIAEIRDKETQYKKTANENIFFDEPEQGEKQSYYFATLCSYIRKLHKPYDQYLKKLENESTLISFKKNDDSDDNNDNFDWLNGI